MSIYIVVSKHDADVCQVGTPEIGPLLLQQLAKVNAAKFGITILENIVADGQHTFYLILEATDTNKVQEFMSPFARMGSVDIWPGTTCQTVVDRGYC